MMTEIVLKKSGFWLKDWNSKTKKNQLIPLFGTGKDKLHPFSGWNDSLTIEGQVKFKDIIVMLGKLSPDVLLTLGALTGANFELYFKELPKQKNQGKDTCKLKCIEVYKYYEQSNYDLKRWDIYPVLCAHGIGKKWKEGEGNSYALEFTPWVELLHLPIKLQDESILSVKAWKKCPKKKVGFFNNKGKLVEHWHTKTKDIDEKNSKEVKINVKFTMGEFLCGLFNELCFFWEPEYRDEQLKELNSRADDLDSKKDEFLEMKEY